MSKALTKRKTAAPAARKAKPAAVAVSAADALATEIRQLIAEARTTAATAVNASLTLLADKENAGALAFYQRLGFEESTTVVRHRRLSLTRGTPTSVPAP